MSKSTRSIFNAISAALFNLCNGLLGFVVTSLVIQRFGSDFNGVNSAANQIVNVLLVLEGGITVATNVALFKPFAKKDNDTVNSIVSATKNNFKKVGVIFLVVGIISALVYSGFVVSSLNREIICSIIVMAVIPSAVNLFFATKYRVVIQAHQKEYVISLISLITVCCGHAVNIISLLYFDINMIQVRIVTMVFALLQSLLLFLYCRRKFTDINFKCTPNYGLIKGTRDVMFLKITSALYSTLPTLSISMFSSAGSAVVSVYSVYNNIFLLIKSLVQSLIDGPRLSLGQLIAEGDKNRTYRQFILYEYTTIMALTLFLGVAGCLVLPFVRWYSIGFTDINYINYSMTVLLFLIAFFEMIHIPSGNYINMSGNFKTAKKIQIIATIILFLGSIIFSIIFDFYGIIISVLCTAIYLAVAEIYIVHKVYLKKCKEFLSMLIVNAVMMILIIFISTYVQGNATFSLLRLIINAIIIFIVTLVLVYSVNYLLFRKHLKEVLSKFSKMLVKRG